MSNPAPAAPDLDTVFDVEGGLEPHIATALKLSGIFDPELERSNAEATTPRVEVRIKIGACISRNKLPAGATNPREALSSAWGVDFEFYVVTDRKVPAQIGAHGMYRARVRRLGASFFRLLNPYLPYHRIEKMNEAGTTPNLTTQDAVTEDVSRILFTGAASVRDTAWPVGT